MKILTGAVCALIALPVCGGTAWAGASATANAGGTSATASTSSSSTSSTTSSTSSHTGTASTPPATKTPPVATQNYGTPPAAAPAQAGSNSLLGILDGIANAVVDTLVTGSSKADPVPWLPALATGSAFPLMLSTPAPQWLPTLIPPTGCALPVGPVCPATGSYGILADDPADTPSTGSAGDWTALHIK